MCLPFLSFTLTEREFLSTTNSVAFHNTGKLTLKVSDIIDNSTQSIKLQRSSERHSLHIPDS